MYCRNYQQFLEKLKTVKYCQSSQIKTLKEKGFKGDFEQVNCVSDFIGRLFEGNGKNTPDSFAERSG